MNLTELKELIYENLNNVEYEERSEYGVVDAIAEAFEVAEKKGIEASVKVFTAFWLDGKAEIIHGKDVTEAFNNAGYGMGALAALDFHAAGNVSSEYVWNSVSRSWDAVK